MKGAKSPLGREGAHDRVRGRNGDLQGSGPGRGALPESGRALGPEGQV